MMKRLLASALFFLAGLPAALGQSSIFPATLPANTVVGRVSSLAGPATAVPIATLAASMLYGETPVADANYSVVSTDRTIVYSTLTAPRTVTLLPASSYLPGTRLLLFNRSATAGVSISVAPSGADLINGTNATAVAINAAYQGAVLETDGVSKWIVPGFPIAQPLLNTIVSAGLACDGVTDESTSFQNILNALTAPATVALPRGTCVLHGITIPTGVSIKGSSTDGTIVAPNANAQTVFSHTYGAVTSAEFGISELTIDCKTFIGATGIAITLAKESTYRNIDIRGCATALVFDRGFDYRVANVTVSGNASQGAGQIKAWSSSDTDHIFNVALNNITTLNIGNGVQADAVYFRRVINSYLSNYGANDLSTGGTPRNGLVIENDTQGVFVNNFIVAAPATGIVLQTGAGAVVAPSFNQVSNFGIDQSTTHGITVASGSYNVFHGGNVAASGVSTTITAISLPGGQNNTFTNITVSGYSGVGGAAFALSGITDQQIFHNQFDNNATCISMPGGAGTTQRIRYVDNNCTNATAEITGSTVGTGNWFTNGGVAASFAQFGNAVVLAGVVGEVGLTKITPSGAAVGAGGLKLEAVAGTNTGTCKIIAYAGTSTTPVTIADNIGGGC